MALKVATPPEALTVLVPDSVPTPPGLLAERDRHAGRAARHEVVVGVEDLDGDRRGESAPPVVLVGCCRKTSLFAAPGVMLKVLLVAPVRTAVLAAVSV